MEVDGLTSLPIVLKPATVRLEVVDRGGLMKWLVEAGLLQWIVDRSG
jgi:hypothetical protein